MQKNNAANEENSREERHAFRNSLLTMEAASALAFERLFGSDDARPVRNTPVARHRIAQALAKVCKLYWLDAANQPRELTPAELVDARFVDGGTRIATPDGRELGTVCVELRALREAAPTLEAVKGELLRAIRQDMAAIVGSRLKPARGN